jgi:hypothetical protein
VGRIVRGYQVVADPDRHDDQAAGFHLQLVGAELTEQPALLRWAIWWHG